MSNFYLFRGKDTDRKNGVPASAFPIIKLMDHPQYKHSNLICFVDNYFNGAKLCRLNLANGVHTAGTVRTNRIRTASSVFYTKTGAEKGKRGDMKCHKLDDGLYTTSWWDMRAVNMLHTFPNFKRKITRHERDKKTAAHNVVELMRPNIIGWYNGGMGGTDLFDQYMSYYRPTVKTKRWPHAIYFHLMLCCVVNAWILHKLINGNTEHEDNGNLLSFINKLVDVMCIKPAEQLDEDVIIILAPIQCKSSSVSPSDSRFSGAHSCVYLTTDDKDGSSLRKMCKMFDCTQKTRSICRQCGVHLCAQVADVGLHYSCHERYHNFLAYPKIE